MKTCRSIKRDYFFFSKYQNEKIMIFGFTSLIWEYFINSEILIKKRLNLKMLLLFMAEDGKSCLIKKLITMILS